jgi:hypothetical protein
MANYSHFYTQAVQPETLYTNVVSAIGSYPIDIFYNIKTFEIEIVFDFILTAPEIVLLDTAVVNSPPNNPNDVSFGGITGTSFNKVIITQPSTTASFTIESGKTLTVPLDASVSNTNTGDQSDETLIFSDNTTNDVSSSLHGFFPKITGLPGQIVKVNTAGTGLTYATLNGGGDMLASVYDPTNVAADVFDYNNFNNKPLFQLNINSTGLKSGGTVSINANPSKFDIAAGTGIIVDNHTIPGTPTISPITWGNLTAITPTYLGTESTTYLAITSTGSVFQSINPLTPTEKRDYINLGWIDHPDNVNVLFAHLEPSYNAEIQSQMNDYFEVFGSFNIYGNDYVPASTNLTIKKTLGSVFDNNSNYETNQKSPHIILNTLDNPCSINYFYRDGGTGWFDSIAATVSIDPNYYDTNSGVLVPVPTGKWSIQVISLYPVTGYSGNDIQYGQAVYDSLEKAKVGVNDAIVLNPYNEPDLYRTYLIVKQGATNLSDPTQAYFMHGGRFGLFSNGDLNKAVVTTLDNLTDVSITTPVVDQIIRYNGASWVNGAASTISAGAGITYFFGNVASGISTYETISTAPASGSEIDESIVVNNNTLAFEAYSTVAALNRTTINAGIWNFHVYSYVDYATASTTLTFTVYKRTSGATESSLFSVTTPDIDSGTVSLFTMDSVQPAFAFTPTDLLVIKVTATTTHTSNVRVHFVYAGTTNYSYVSTPLATLHNDLAGLQGGTSNEFYHLTNTQLNVVTQTSGTNSGDNATNTQYSGLVTNATHTGEVTGSTTLTLDKTAITNKTAVTIVGTDYLIFSDTSDSGNLKKALASDLVPAASTIVVMDEGLTASSVVTKLNFTGAGVTVTGTGATASIDIPGSAGGGPSLGLSLAISYGMGMV